MRSSGSAHNGQGLVRDMRVRWALEEVGQPYEARLLLFTAMKEPVLLAWIIEGRAGWPVDAIFIAIVLLNGGLGR